jgi:hypothetical protein
VASIGGPQGFISNAVLITTDKPVLLGYVKGSTRLAALQQNPVVLGDQNGTSILLLKQGLNLGLSGATTVFIYADLAVIAAPLTST